MPGTWVFAAGTSVVVDARILGLNDGVYVFREGYWGTANRFTAAWPTASAMTVSATRAAIGETAFFYNRSVNNISNVSITNVYNKTVVVTNVTNVSYNGGTRHRTADVAAKAAIEHHVVATAAQTQNVQAAA